MTIDIRNILVPFATDMGPAKIHRLDNLEDNDILLHMSITKVTGIIYDDGNHSVSVPVWCYNTTASLNEGTAGFPSTGLVVRKNQTVRIDWHNDVDPEDPFSPVDEMTLSSNDKPVPQNTLGTQNEVIECNKPQARFVTHLHGGRVAPSYDGWPESVIEPGQTLRDCYENKDRATMHWFHDHAMHTTASNVFAGLAAPYIIRDNEEAALKLPEADDELALVIQDRNLSADITEIETAFSGNSSTVQTSFLRKVEKDGGPLEFFGPLTLVNGKIWPSKSVPAKWQRIRILNGSNSRTYALQFVETDKDGQVATMDSSQSSDNKTVNKVDVPILQIGADGGLLEKSITLTGKPIILMPAQRIDLLVDFRNLANRRIALINIAPAPFGGSIRILDKAYPKVPENDLDRTPYPEVMRFDVGDAVDQGQDYSDIDQRLSQAINLVEHLPKPEDVTVERVIGLVEKDMGNGESMLVTLELVPEEIIPSFAIAPYQALRCAHTVTIDNVNYRVCAERFQDPVNFQIKYGATERWRFVNLSPDSHPMHLHLVQFLHEKTTPILTIEGKQVGAKTPSVMANTEENFNVRLAKFVNGSFINGTCLKVTLGDSTPEQNKILRDTVRVDPGTVVDILARFEGYHGRYLYHCHLLEHEDNDMMRQYVVTRSDLHKRGLDGDRVPIMGSIGK